MEIEPLKNILDIYKDKNKIVMEYLPTETTQKLKNHSLYDESEVDLYLNDSIVFVQKNTGKLFAKGKIIAIDENKITIKGPKNCMKLNKNDYYIFIKQKMNKTSNRDFYKALLNQL